MLDHWAEIVLRNAALTMGWVVAAVLLFMLFVSAIGGGAGNGNDRNPPASVRKPREITHPGAAACAACAKRERRKRERMRELQRIANAVPDEPRRSRRVGPPNPRAGEPARAPRSRVDVTA